MPAHRNRPVVLLGTRPLPAKTEVPAYVSGLRAEQACACWEAGFRSFKLYYDGDEAALRHALDAVRPQFPQAVIAVDALWRLTPENAVDFGRKLDDRDALWLECPLMPEDPEAHPHPAG